MTAGPDYIIIEIFKNKIHILYLCSITQKLELFTDQTNKAKILCMIFRKISIMQFV